MTVLRDQSFPLDDYPSGIHQLPESLVNDEWTHLYIEISRCTTATPDIWPDENQIINYRSEISFDNGKTWLGGGGFSANGGIVVNWRGEESPVVTINVPLPPKIDRKRRLRGTIEIINGPIRTQGFYELRDDQG